MKRRARLEDQLQRAIVQHYCLRKAPGVFMFAVPNGGARRPIEAAILKATGVVAGTPDTVWIKGGQAFALELKSETGRLSDAQRATIERMKAAGCIVGVAHGLDEALRFLELNRLLRGAVQ
jgi:VRR-NUC domain